MGASERLAVLAGASSPAGAPPAGASCAAPGAAPGACRCPVELSDAAAAAGKS